MMLMRAIHKIDLNFQGKEQADKIIKTILNSMETKFDVFKNIRPCALFIKLSIDCIHTT